MSRIISRGVLHRVLHAARALNHATDGRPPPTALRGHRLTRRFVVAATLAAPFAARAAAPRVVPGGVAVIGGGLAGLNAAWHLRKAGVTATVYEAATRLGGRVQSVTSAVGPGLVTELGGEAINTEHADMMGLVAEFGLGPLFDRRRDARRLRGLPAEAYLVDGLPRREAALARRFAPLVRRIAADAARVDRNFGRYAPEIDALSVTAYLNQQPELVADPIVRRLIDVSIRGEYGVESDASSALQLIYNLPSVDGEALSLLTASDERFTIPGGNARLVEALGTALGAQVERGRRLVALDRADAESYRLRFADGSTATAARVIVAIPPTVWREVAVSVRLVPALARFLGAAQLGANEKVIAGFDTRAWRRPDGFVVEATADSGFAYLWDATQRQTEVEHGALTFYLGGREVAAAEGTAREIGERFLRRFDAVLPGAAAAANGRFVRTRWGRNPLTRGAYSVFGPGQLTSPDLRAWVEGPQGRILDEVRSGNLWFAGEHLSDAHWGFMNGAAETGRLAAQSLLADLGPPAG